MEGRHAEAWSERQKARVIFLLLLKRTQSCNNGGPAPSELVCELGLRQFLWWRDVG